MTNPATRTGSRRQLYSVSIGIIQGLGFERKFNHVRQPGEATNFNRAASTSRSAGSITAGQASRVVPQLLLGEPVREAVRPGQFDALTEDLRLAEDQ